MTRRFREWSERTRWRAPDSSAPWTALVPPGWQGFCVHCRRRLTVADWEDGQIAAIGDGDPWHCLCMKHLGAGRPEYQDALNALARAVAGA